MIGASVLLAFAALIVAVVALREARNEPGTYAGVGAVSIARLHGLMTQDEVRMLLGTAATVFRDNPRRAVLGLPLTVRSAHVLRPKATPGLVGIERAAEAPD